MLIIFNNYFPPKYPQFCVLTKQSTIDGIFYEIKKGCLDKKLIEDPLNCLGKFPQEKQEFLDALNDYSNNNFKGTISNCYLAIEGVARKILKNGKTLENNRDELVARLELSQDWKALFKKYLDYANNFRHASKGRKINKIEVEAFLYLTGLLIRLIVQAI